MPKTHKNKGDREPLITSELSEDILFPIAKSRKRPSRNYRRDVSRNEEDNLPLIVSELSSHVFVDKHHNALDDHHYHDEMQSLQSATRRYSQNITSHGVCEKLPIRDFGKLLKPQESTKPPGLISRMVSRLPKPPAFVGKVFPWVTSKGVVKAVNIIIPAVAFAGIGVLSGGIVPAVAVGIAAGTIIFNSIRDTRSLRALKELEQEHHLLHEYQLALNIEKAANNLVTDKTGVDLARAYDADITRINAKNEFKSKYENNLTSRSLGKTIRDNVFESLGNAATAAVVATSGLANAAMAAVFVGVTAGVLGIVDIAITTANRRKVNIVKNGMRENIDILREDVPHYSSIAELRLLTREQKIKTEALHQLATQDLSGCDKDSLENMLNLQKVMVSQKFEVPLKPTFWNRTKQYFKDFNAANWPNDYYTGSRFSDKLDRDHAELITRYDAVYQGIQNMSKAHGKANVMERCDLSLVQEVTRGRRNSKKAAGRGFA